MQIESKPKRPWWMKCRSLLTEFRIQAGPPRESNAPERPMRKIERRILRKLAARMREERRWMANLGSTT